MEIIPADIQLKRFRQVCAISDTHPTFDILAFMQQKHIDVVKICSINQQAEPQNSINSERWQGGALIFVKTGVKPGCKTTHGFSIYKWRSFFQEIGWEFAEFQLQPSFKRKTNTKIWDTFAQMLDPLDTRITELKTNTFQLNFPINAGPQHMCPVTSAIVSARQELRVAQEIAQAAQDCQEAERASMQALERPMLGEELSNIRKRSLESIRRLVRAEEELNNMKYFGNQPHSKHKANKQIGHKSKKPEHVAKRLKPSTQEKSAPAPQLALTLQETVVSKQLPQPTGEEWKYRVAAFLREAQPQPGAEVEILKFLVPESVHNFIASKSKNHPGSHYPARETDSDPTSTLELHRCVLLLEKTAEEMLRNCVAKCEADQSLPADFSADDANDMQIAWCFGGGLQAKPGCYWAEQQAQPMSSLPLPAMEGEFHRCCALLKAERAKALHRHYLLVDRITWAIPYLSKAYSLKCASIDPDSLGGNVKEAFTKITEFRGCAIKADRAPLVNYAVNFLKYANRVAAVAAALHVFKKPPRLLKKVADVLEAIDPAHKGHTGPASACPDKDLPAIKRRKNTEIMEFRDMLTSLGLESSPLLKSAQTVCEKIGRAMACDTHQLQMTSFLYPSPSLTSATCNLQMYVVDQPAV